MTEPDTLSRDIRALAELQRLAWSQLASPTLTLFDRREIRNRIRQSEVELRAFLKLRAERPLHPEPPVEVAARQIARPNFRLFAGI